MTISAIFGSRIVVPNSTMKAAAAPKGGGGGMGLVIECSSRPQKKATSHHMKTRPKKTQPWDKNRRPTVYAPLPPLPPDWTLASADEPASVPPPPSPQPVENP